MSWTVRVRWNGVGDEAFDSLDDSELSGYVSRLEAALSEVHGRFAYMSQPAGGVSLPKRGDHLLFDGDYARIGRAVTGAVLEMYRLHRTPFRPNPVPAGREDVIWFQ